MTRTFTLTVEGESVAKGRPRLANVGGHARAFTPAKTRRYEDVVRQRATQGWNGAPLISAPIALSLLFVREIPASWSKRKQREAGFGALQPCGRPDLDNLAKSVTDGLNGVLYRDDALIWRLSASKVYGDRPRVEIELTWDENFLTVEQARASLDTAPLFEEPQPLAAAPAEDRF